MKISNLDYETKYKPASCPPL